MLFTSRHLKIPTHLRGIGESLVPGRGTKNKCREKVLAFSSMRMHIQTYGAGCRVQFSEEDAASNARQLSVQNKSYSCRKEKDTPYVILDLSKKISSTYANIKLKLIYDHGALSLKVLRHCEFISGLKTFKHDSQSLNKTRIKSAEHFNVVDGVKYGKFRKYVATCLQNTVEIEKPLSLQK